MPQPRILLADVTTERTLFLEQSAIDGFQSRAGRCCPNFRPSLRISEVKCPDLRGPERTSADERGRGLKPTQLTFDV